MNLKLVQGGRSELLQGSELLFELLLVREQDTTDHDQDKWLECLDMARVPETVTLGEAWFAVHGTQHLDVWTPGD